MTIDIQDDDLSVAYRIKLRERGWRWDADAQEWRHINHGNHSLPQNVWAADAAEVEAEVQAERQAAQMNATPGHTGTD